jgi:hypothetical protein
LISSASMSSRARVMAAVSVARTGGVSEIKVVAQKLATMAMGRGAKFLINMGHTFGDKRMEQTE